MNWENALTDTIRKDRIMGLPLACHNPESLKTALSQDAYQTMMGFKGMMLDLDGQIRTPQLMKLTRDRLKKIRAALDTQCTNLERLLKPLGYAALPFSEFNEQQAQNRSGGLLMQHYEHLFRDWNWGEKETQAMIEVTKRLLPQIRTENILFLGAGACRFPFELHGLLKPAYSLCLDQNPFLLSCAKKIIEGETLELVEFPTIPQESNLFTVQTKLQRPHALEGSFEYLVHDIEEWSLKEKSFDLVVTPWFIDVVPVPPRRLFSLINNVLKPGGIWLNIGPVGFNKSHLTEYLSREEVLYIAETQSFKIQKHEFTPMPYFQNPSSSHWRTEYVLGFVARKDADCEVVQAEGIASLPDWAEDFNAPIDLPADTENLKRSYGFCLDLIKRVSKDSTVQQLAKDLGPSHGLSQEQAEHLISQTLFQWVDANRNLPVG